MIEIAKITYLVYHKLINWSRKTFLEKPIIMNHVIDHAINIPVTQESLWTIISDPEKNTGWHTGYKSVSYLNSIRRKQGMRWRYTDRQGHAYVVEVTAWYEGYGYEYRIIDGTPFSDNRGRIRLQETPDATTVQWTFSYELSGFMGGVRNALGLKRRLDEEVVASLKNLYRLRESLTPIKESKSLMRKAPDVSERQLYRSRYFTQAEQDEALEAEARQADEAFMPPVAITQVDELPISVDDTPPNPNLKPIILEEPPPPPYSELFAPPSLHSTSEPEPSFLAGISTASTPAPAAASKEIAPTPIPTNNTAVPATPSSITEPLPFSKDDTQETIAAKAVSNATPSSQDLPLASPNLPVIPIPAIETGTLPTPAPIIRPEIDKRDTASVSVFELFNLQPPSATQEMRALDVAKLEASITENLNDTQETMSIVADVNPHEPQRAGLRRYLRRKLYRLRMPF